MVRVVRDEEDAAAALEVRIVRVDRNFQFLCLSGVDAALADAHADARVINLERTDDERGAARVAQNEFARNLFLLAQGAQCDVRAVDGRHRSESVLRGRVEEVRQERGRHVDFRVLADAVAGEAAQVDARLGQPHLAEASAVEREDDASRTAGADYFGDSLRHEVFRQVHQFRAVRLLARVVDIEYRGRFVAAVHVVELNVVRAEEIVADLVGIFHRRFRLRERDLSHQ